MMISVLASLIAIVVAGVTPGIRGEAAVPAPTLAAASGEGGVE
jgi:hypothetical protein